MNHRFPACNYWFLSVLTILSIFPSLPLQAQDSLTVITYNIWNGFDWGKDEDRRQRLTQWVDQQQPDIVALQELCGYTQEKLLEDAQQWGHNYAVILKTTGYPVGITSSQPITVIDKIFEGMHHGALHVWTQGLEVMVIHFSPSSYAKRREESKIILSRLEEIRERNPHYLVLGDFNAPSPMDADLYPDDSPLLQRMRESNKDKPLKGNLFQNNLDYAVLSSFLAFPLLDVCQPFTLGIEARGSFPGLVLAKDKASKALLKARLERIDFILASPALAQQCTSARVCNGAENAYLSDHYPVLATFRKRDATGLK